MQRKYCLIPDKDKFFSFLASLSFSQVEMMQLKLMHINQICIDESSSRWEIHFSCAAHLTGELIQAAAKKLAAAFCLRSVDMICDGDGLSCQLPVNRREVPDVEITDCTGEVLTDDVPLPPEPPEIEIGNSEPIEQEYCLEEDLDYKQAVENLYGSKKMTAFYGESVSAV